MTETPKRPPMDPKTATMKELAPGIWRDSDHHMHFSIPDMLDSFGWPHDDEHTAMVEQVIRDFLKTQYPNAKIQVSDNRLDVPYREGRLPLYWQDEETGTLAAVVTAYYCDLTSQEPMKPADLDLLKAYLVYVIEAPCWQIPDRQAVVDLIDNAADAESIAHIMDGLLDIGIDPF